MRMDRHQLTTAPLAHLKRYYLQNEALVTEEVIHTLEHDPRKGAQTLGKFLRARKLKKQEEQERINHLLYWETRLWNTGYARIAGVDEVGMGPLAGPVVAAAVVVSPTISIPGVNDSKALAPGRREILAQEIWAKADGIGIGVVEPAEIDRLNIYRAGLKAMQLAVEALPFLPDYLLIDGRNPLPLFLPQQTLVRGDQESYSIAAASIVAKVYRDQLMLQYHNQYPLYGFAQHKGYGTAEHLTALRLYGPCPIHRRSYRPVGQVDYRRQANS